MGYEEEHSDWSQKQSAKATDGGKKSKPGKGKKGKSRPSSLEALRSSLPGLSEVHEAVERKLSGRMTHELDNPYRTIHIDVPHYWETEDTVLSFLEQFVGGYVWACKHDETFIAVHDEAPRLQQLYDRVLAYRAAKADPDKDEEEFYGQRFVAWSLVELATVLPSMWD